MNAQQRKIIRDAHVARLGGIGATVVIRGFNKPFKARLCAIEGADRAQVTFINRSKHVSNPIIFEYKAVELEVA